MPMGNSFIAMSWIWNKQIQNLKLNSVLWFSILVPCIPAKHRDSSRCGWTVWWADLWLVHPRTVMCPHIIVYVIFPLESVHTIYGQSSAGSVLSIKCTHTCMCETVQYIMATLVRKGLVFYGNLLTDWDAWMLLECISQGTRKAVNSFRGWSGRKAESTAEGTVSQPIPDLPNHLGARQLREALLGKRGSLSSLLQWLFSWRRSNSLCVRPHSLAQRSGTSGESPCQFHPSPASERPSAPPGKADSLLACKRCSLLDTHGWCHHGTTLALAVMVHCWQ